MSFTTTTTKTKTRTGTAGASTTAYICFPPPPPTRNELSSEQRARLIRTNNKLGQVLGSTPHVLDLTYIVSKTEMPMHVPPKSPTPSSSSSSRNPFRTHARTKSVPRVDVDAVRAGSKSPESVASRASTSTSSSSSTSSHRSTKTSVRVRTDELAWRTPYSIHRPPLLQLSVPRSHSHSHSTTRSSPSRKPRLETIPGSPTAPGMGVGAVIEPPSFALPSEASMRREKMRRVRKMLGDGVPTDLVFPSPAPQEWESEDEGESEEESPVVSTPTSTMSREWLLVNVEGDRDRDEVGADVNKPLPAEPAEAVRVPVGLPLGPKSTASRGTKGEGKEPVVRRNLLYKERAKEKPSKAARRLESIAESARETRPESYTVVGVSVSAGVDGRGKSRRFVKGDIAMDQITTPWGNWW